MKAKEDPHNKKKNHEPMGKGHKDDIHKKGDKQPQLEEGFESFSKFLEGREELRKTSRSFEKKLKRANQAAADESGRPNFPRLNQIRKKILKKAEEKRSLRRGEYIKLYGYQAWLDYVKKHDIPENSKWADAHKN